MSNAYYPLKSEWTLEQWQEYCPNFAYRVVKQNEFPPFLPNKLRAKFNSAIVVASGSATNQTFVFQGYRIDGGELDEHQYIVSFDLSASTSYAGFVEHADYEGRTTPIPAEMQQSMSLSGVYIDFAFPRKPSSSSGSLDELIKSGLIKGFTNSVETQNKNKTS